MNVAGCQHHPEIDAGEDLQVAYMQNAHIASCCGTDFEYDPNCGTYLEACKIYRPAIKLHKCILFLWHTCMYIS